MASGKHCIVPIPSAMTILSAHIFTDVVSDVSMDVRVDSYANYPPAAGDSIVASNPITITASDKAEDTVLTGWDTALAAGDVLMFYLNSNTSAKYIHVQLRAILL